jgi:hypothetical protein
MLRIFVQPTQQVRTCYLSWCYPISCLVPFCQHSAAINTHGALCFFPVVLFQFSFNGCCIMKLYARWEGLILPRSRWMRLPCFLFSFVHRHIKSLCASTRHISDKRRAARRSPCEKKRTAAKLFAHCGHCLVFNRVFNTLDAFCSSLTVRVAIG